MSTPPKSRFAWRTWCKRTALAALALLLLLLGTVVAARFILISCTESPAAGSVPNDLPARLRADVEALCAHPRYGDEVQRAHARDYIVQRLRAAGWHVELQPYRAPTDPDEAGSEQQTYWNISATHPQQAREGVHATGRRYVVGAHYDACDTGEGNPGADDNASACAALLALADMLAPPAGENAPALEFAFYACEEPPWFGTEYMGSAQHAAACKAEDIAGMVCLEMLGCFSDEEGSQPEFVPGQSLIMPMVGNFIAIVGDSTAFGLARQAQRHFSRGMPALRANIPFAQGTELFFSDHRNYAPLGIPSIMVTDTALARNDRYHEPTDTPDTLYYRRLALVTRNLADFIRGLPQP